MPTLLRSALMLLATAPMLAHAGTIEVVYGPVDVPSGAVACALFDAPRGFPGGSGAIAQVRGEFTDGTAICRFKDVAAGTYAISAFHDMDGDGKLKTNLVGLPRETFAVSNNAPSHFGPPRFDDAKFTFDGGTLRLPLHAK